MSGVLETKDEEHVDYLEVDTPLPGQNYCCISFISPDKVLEKKDSFIMKKFIKSLADENGSLTMNHSDFDSKYEDYISSHGEQLDADFAKEVGFQTSVRGLKIRGTYNTYEEAARRAASPRRRGAHAPPASRGSPGPQRCVPCVRAPCRRC